MRTAAVHCAVWCIVAVATLGASPADGGATAPATRSATAPAADANVAARIGRLIERLSSEKYAEREAAFQELLRLGPAAAGALQAADANGEAERAVRISEVLRQIEAGAAERAWQDAARLLPSEWPPKRFLSGARFAGLTVDANGKPLPDTLVTLQSASMGQDLWWAFVPRTRSDANGRFEFAIPFDDILYQSGAQRMGYCQPNVAGAQCATPQVHSSARVVLSRIPDPHILTGTVQADGKPVPDVEIQLLGEYGERAVARTDKEGRFTLQGLSQIFQAVALVRSGDLVAPLQIVHIPRKEPLEIALEKAAELEGEVLEEPGGKPIPGATVFVWPTFASGLQLTATTDGNGRYRLGGIPPGEYQVTAESAAHFHRPPGGQSYNLPRVSLLSGEATTVDLRLERAAILQGRVANRRGEAAAGALVCVMSSCRGDYRGWYRYVEADKDGRFAIATGHVGDDQQLTLSAFASREGQAQGWVGPLAAGRVYSAITLQLPGAVYAKGTVTDPNGVPIPGVACVIEGQPRAWVQTDAAGQFGLGRVTLNSQDPNQRSAIQFYPPRPQGGDAYGHSYSPNVPVESRQKAPQFYLNDRVILEHRPGAELDLRVVLQPTQLLELTGVVVDANDVPVPAGRVILFPGGADANEWAEDLHPNGSGNGRMVIRWSTPIASVQTDPNGRWRIWTVRENSGPALAFTRTNWKRFCIGAHFDVGGIPRGFEGQPPGCQSIFVRDVAVPEDAPHLDLRLKLQPTPVAPAKVGR